MTSSPRDLVIIGSGPAGYTAAIYAARAGLSPVVLAGSVTAGGALMNTTEVENFPGFVDGVMGPDLMETMRKQAERFGAEILFDDAVEVALDGPVKTVVTGSGDTYRARAVILAMGSAYRELGLSDEKRMSGHGVSWCATCDGFFFRGQHVVVVGGGDSAVEEATFLHALRGDRDARAPARPAPRLEDHGGPRGRRPQAPLRLEQRDHRDPRRAEGHRHHAAGHGHRRRARARGVRRLRGDRTRPAQRARRRQGGDRRRGIRARGRGRRTGTATSVAGVFACGDLVDHVYRQAITAAGTGCAAALDAQHYLADLVDAGTPPAPAALPEKIEETL